MARYIAPDGAVFVNSSLVPWRHFHVNDRLDNKRQGSHTDPFRVHTGMDRTEVYAWAEKYEKQQPEGRRTDVKSCMNQDCLKKTDTGWEVKENDEP